MQQAALALTQAQARYAQAKNNWDSRPGHRQSIR